MPAESQTDILFRAVLDVSNIKQSVEHLKKGIDDLSAKQAEHKNKADQAAKASENFSQKLTGMAKAVAGAYVVSQLAGFLKEAAGQALQAAESQARLSAVLRATGGTAGFTADQLADYAGKLEEATGVSDEAIKDSMAVLATFRSVQGETFKDATSLALDMAAVFGTDLRSASTMLGKALEDPIQGVTALRRVGVSLTEQQREQIQAFIEAGEKAKAQGVILDALRVQVGGAAQAVKGATGGLRDLGVALGNVKEAIGGVIVGATKGAGVLQWLTDAARKLAEGLQILAQGQKSYDYTANLTAHALENLIKKKQEQLEQLNREREALPKTSEAYHQKTQQVGKLILEIKQLTGVLEKKRSQEQVAAEAIQDTTAAEAKRREETEKAAKALEELRQTTKALLDSLFPTEKKAKDFASAVVTLTRAEEAGLVSHIEIKQALAELGETVAKIAEPALKELKQAFESGQLKADVYREAIRGVQAAVERLQERQDLEQFSKDWDAAIRNVREFKNILKQPTPPPPPPSLFQWEQFFAEISGGLSQALTAGVLNTLAGDDFARAWADLWQELASQSAEVLASALQSALTGELKEGLQKTGLITAEGKPVWERVGQFVGPLVLASGVAQQNRGQAALGGAITGAGFGASLGGPWGAVIGAVLGAAYAYFSVQDQKRRVALRFGGGRPAFLEAEGPTQAQENEMLRQLQSTFRGYRGAIIGIFEELGQIPAEVFAGLSRVQLQISDQVRDVSAWWQQVLRGDLPRAMLQQVRQPLEQAISGLGVSAERARQEINRLFGEDFQAALEALARYVNALVGLRRVSELLGQSVDELVQNATQTVRQQFLHNIDQAIDRAGELTAHLGDLFSDEQVERAAQLVSLAEQQYRDTLAYIAQLSSLSRNIQESIDQAFFSFGEARAREKGPYFERRFLLDELAQIQQRLRQAASPEELQTLWQRFMAMAQRLWQLAGEGDTVDESLRQFVERQIHQTGDFAQQLIRQWEEEARQRQELLKNEVDTMLQALQNTASGLEELGGGARDGREKLDELTDAAGDLTESARELEDGFRRLLAAADELSERMDAMGGLVAVSVALDDGLQADVYGDSDLVRLTRLGGAA